LEEARSQLATVQAEKEALNRELEEARSELAEARDPQHQLYTKIKELEERNRLLCIKNREERQKLEEEIKILKYRGESQGRRLAEKQNRLDELESAAELLQQNPAPAINLSDKAGKVADYLKTLLCDEKLLNSILTKIKRNKQVQLPKEVISKVEQILSDNDKKPPTDARELLNEG
jgi:DNA repair exonuclease SbcCD ATPase subunit